MSNKKELNEEELENVNGGCSHNDETYGRSYSFSDLKNGEIPVGTNCIYTEARDNYMPHKVIYEGCKSVVGGAYIVLKPSNAEATNYFASQLNYEKTNIKENEDNKEYYDVDYCTFTDNHLYKE